MRLSAGNAESFNFIAESLMAKCIRLAQGRLVAKLTPVRLPASLNKSNKAHTTRRGRPSCSNSVEPGPTVEQSKARTTVTVSLCVNVKSIPTIAELYPF
jgi:hypothetical protein